MTERMIGFPPEPPPEMAHVHDAPDLVPFTAPKAREGAEPDVVPGFIAGTLKSQYVNVTDDEGKVVGRRLAFFDDAGTEHPAPTA